VPVITGPQILVSSSEVVLDQKPAGKHPLKQFAKGQIVSAKVLQAVSGRRALLLIGGEKVTAKTFLPLQAGQTILLKLEQAGDRQVFRFAGQPGETAGSGQPVPMGSFGKAGPYMMLAQLLDELEPPKTGEGTGPLKHLAALKDLVATLTLKSETPSPAFLERLMGGSGLLWESKLAALVSRGTAPTPEAVANLVAGDLKATCLRLLSGTAGALPEALAGQLRGVLEGLEQHQLLNQHLLENDGRYLLPIPLSDQQVLKFGQLLLGLGGREGEGNRKDRLVTVSFLLSLTQLGEFRADFSILKTGVTGAFGVADEAARALVMEHLPELKQKLRDHGYSIFDISCRVLESQHLSEMSLVSQAVAQPDEGFFNLVV
jgi:hypothetical protein